MRRIAFIAALLLPIGAQAQQPITLSPQEYDAIVSAIADRDPVLSFLIKKQKAAQEAAKPKQEAPQPTPQQP